MSGVENMFLGIGFSWTMSKALPYMLTVVIGFILVMLFRKKFRHNLLLKWAIRLMLFVLPFSLYFFYSPIYEGDFSNNVSEVERVDTYREISGQKLVVLSLPNCPYCYESIDRAQRLLERVPEAQVEYVVCGTVPEQLEWYSEKAGEAITVRLADSLEAMSALADHRFPTFILVDGDNKPLKKWSNDGFGVVAMDAVELALK